MVDTIKFSELVSLSVVSLSAKFPIIENSENYTTSISAVGDALQGKLTPLDGSVTSAKLDTNITITGNVLASNLSGTNTGDVTVTDSSEIDFTLTGQNLTASLIAGSIDESKLDASVNASLDLADTSVQSNITGVTGADAITNIMSLTQAEYDVITPVANTLYVIV